MEIACRSSGIMAADYPRQGIGDIANAGFAGIMLDLSSYCPRHDLENYGRRGIRRKVSGLLEDVSSLGGMLQPAVDACQKNGLKIMSMYAPFLRRDT